MEIQGNLIVFKHLKTFNDRKQKTHTFIWYFGKSLNRRHLWMSILGLFGEKNKQYLKISGRNSTDTASLTNSVRFEF